MSVTPLGQPQHLAAAGRRPEARRTLRNGRERNVELDRHGRRRQHVGEVAAADQRRRQIERSSRRGDAWRRCPSIPRSSTAVARTSASRVDAERHDAAGERDESAATIRSSSALATSTVERRGALENLGLRVGDGVDRREEPQMRLADVGPDPDVRFSDAHQRADFAGVIHPQFDDRDLRPLPQLDERQRQPDVVVEVPAVADHAIPRREKLRRHFLRRGLAGAAGDRHDLRARRAPHRLRQRLQRRRRVVDLDDRGGRGRAGVAPARDRARIDRRRAAPAAIAAAAKSAPSNRSPRIATNSSPGASVRVSIDTPPNSASASPAADTPCPAMRTRRPTRAVSRISARRPRLGVPTRRPSWSAAARAPRAPPPRRRTAARWSPMTWYFSCPLPAISTRSPGRASSMAFRDRLAAIDDRQQPLAAVAPRIGRDAALDLLDDPCRDPRCAGCRT